MKFHWRCGCLWRTLQLAVLEEQLVLVAQSTQFPPVALEVVMVLGVLTVVVEVAVEEGAV